MHTHEYSCLRQQVIKTVEACIPVRIHSSIRNVDTRSHRKLFFDKISRNFSMHPTKVILGKMSHRPRDNISPHFYQYSFPYQYSFLLVFILGKMAYRPKDEKSLEMCILLLSIPQKDLLRLGSSKAFGPRRDVHDSVWEWSGYTQYSIYCGGWECSEMVRNG